MENLYVDLGVSRISKGSNVNIMHHYTCCLLLACMKNNGNSPCHVDSI